MKNFQSKNVLITGGASGIGKIMSRLMLERGANVIIWDMNSNSISETVNELAHKGNIKGYTINITNTKRINELFVQTTEENGNVEVLINNAGIVTGKYFHEQSNDDIDKTMSVNSTAPMHISLAFLPSMIENKSGHICNIASSAGLVSNPKMSVYAASKWALVGWSDSLRLEMDKMKSNVKVTTIMPYYINTGMFDGVKSKLPILDPEAASLTIIKAIEKDIRMLTLPGYIYRFTRIGQAIMSINFFDWFAGSFLGIYKTMEDFKGRK